MNWPCEVRVLLVGLLVACGASSNEKPCPTFDPFVPTEEPPSLPEGCPGEYFSPCKDTDQSADYPDGLDPYTRGECTAASGNIGLRTPDVCFWHDDRAGRLHEASCVDGECVRDEVGVRCDPGMICRGGKCVTGDDDESFCVDEDEGDPFTRGEVQASDTYGATDDCFRTRVGPTGRGVVADECEPANELATGDTCGVLEKTCGDGDSSIEVLMLCEHGCDDGACLRE